MSNSLAVFDRITGQLIFSIESNEADVDLTYLNNKDIHHCVKDIHSFPGKAEDCCCHDGVNIKHVSDCGNCKELPRHKGKTKKGV